jgi:hypothetical protein
MGKIRQLDSSWETISLLTTTMAFKTLLILVVVAVLMEDGLSIKKRTKEEEEEDERIEAEVNRTLAAEEAKKKKREKEKKKKLEVKGAEKEDVEKKRGEEASLVFNNISCPTQKLCPEVGQCPPCETCPEIRPCRKCPDPVDCGPCQECPPVKECGPCPPIRCKPCLLANATGTDLNQPPTTICPDATSMSVSVALVVGASAGALLTGVAAVIGLALRYASPFENGFVFLATIIIVWYLCSHYPETARELGGRAATLLREAAVALGHRVMEAIRHHQEQVDLPILISRLVFQGFFI